MSTIDSFEDLVVWQRAMDLMVECYSVSRRFPRDERFGLTSQLQRASLSVPSNIAEGNGRPYRGEYLHHLGFAQGSLNETRTLLLASIRLGYTHRDALSPQLELNSEVGRRLSRLRAALSRPEPA